ncbi:hypothetical protein U1E44_11105 [Arenibacter sp. GZD96]|uniref:hypothetical protein n=1 Tax=Aurantibrevibacter litoralis TaxID=3106030 RepID=UPI002AFF9064|nr:hypothetical protein [Arenibacter sp. GZD-96]MEA1786642.1 hypothetical protein [Arenibacter sp. GZD-96]
MITIIGGFCIRESNVHEHKNTNEPIIVQNRAVHAMFHEFQKPSYTKNEATRCFITGSATHTTWSILRDKQYILADETTD